MIETDARLRRVVATLDDRPELATNDMMNEMMRLLRDVPVVRLGAHMEDARLRLSANRSRIVYVKLTCWREHAYLVRARGGLRDHLQVRYGQYLRGVSTESGRSALLNRALAPFDRRIAPLKTTLEVADMVLNDYDARGFAFKDTVLAVRIREHEA